MRGRCLQLLRCLGLLMGLLCILAGCGGNSGSNDMSGTVSRGRPLSLQFQRSSDLALQSVSKAQSQGLVAAEVRQVQPGDPGFIERIVIRLQAQGSDLVLPQVFTLAPTEQEIVTLEVTVPDTAPTTFQVLVSCFNPQGIEVFRGDTSVALGQTSAVVTLVRAALVPVPATPANLQQTTFNFADGAIFGLANIPATLATGTFAGNVGDFALAGNGLVASGSLVIGSCTFLVATSTFPAGQGLQVGDQLILDPCQIDAIDRRLIVTNATVRLTATSSPPVVIPPDTTLNLPTPPALVIDENTSGALQIGTSVSGTRPGTVALGITIPPAHGTATLTSTGILTYQPVANFNSSDRLVVTVVVSFTDNNSPALLLGTVPVLITVRPGNDAPVLTSPGNQTSQEGATVALNIVASDVDGDPLSFSAINLPPGLSINGITPTTAVISGTIAHGAATGSPYNVTVTVSDGVATTSTSLLWTVLSLSAPINSGTVSIVSPAGPVQSGTSFSVPVVVNTGATNVLSYLFELAFDPKVVLVTSITQGSPLFEVPIMNIGTPAAASGTVRLAANNPTFAPANGVLTLATITFHVIGSPGMTSPLKLQFPLLSTGGTGVLVDSNFQAIGGITFVQGAVTVN
jgi:Cohesin domain/Bacterial Ig domain